MNRGLIEAAIPKCRQLRSLKLPRFMNRGLIEACLGLAGTLGYGDFPDS